MEDAGVHHNPTPGPADGEWLYGQNWVALAWLAMHPLWGLIAMPLRSMLYVREADVPQLAEKHDWEFRTKHQLGVELLIQFMQSIRAVTRQYKTFLATSRLVSGQIRVVVIRFEDGGWVPSFCTDTEAPERNILEEKFLAALPPTPNNRRLHRLFGTLLDLAI